MNKREERRLKRFSRYCWTIASVAAVVAFLTILSVAAEQQGVSHGHTGRQLLSTSDQDEAIRKLIELRRKYPRRNFAGDEVSSDFNPTDKDYQESMVLIGMPGFVLAVVSLLGGIIFFSLRCCCGLCGGKKTRLQRLYTRRQRVSLMIALTFVGAVTAVAAILGLVGNSQFSKGLNRFTTAMTDGVDRVAGEIDIVINQLDSLRGVDSRTNSNDLFAARSRIQNIIADTNAQVQKIDSARVIVVSFALVVGILAMLMGMLSALMRKGIMSTIMLIFCIVCLFTTWLAFGFHFPVSVMIADLCDAIGKFLDNGTQSDGGIGTFMQCLPTDDYALQLQQGNEGILVETNRINEMLIGRPDIGTPSFNISDVEQTGKQLTQLTDQIAEFKRQGLPLPQDLEVTVDRASGYQIVLATIQSMQECTRVNEAYQNIHYQLCFKSLKGLDLVLIGTALVGVFFLPACVIAVLGARWFKKPGDLKQREPTSDDLEARAAFADADDQEMREFEDRNQSAHLAPDQWNKV